MHALGWYRRIVAGGVAVSVALTIETTASFAQSQSTALILTGTTVAFGPPTLDDYVSGFAPATESITFLVLVLDDLVKDPRRTTTVSIRATSVNLGVNKPIGHVEWRRADLPDWNALTPADKEVETRVVTTNQNNPWLNTILFRVIVKWEADAPAVYTATFQLTLSQTFP